MTRCPNCGELLLLVPSGAVCSRDLSCSGLHTAIDRQAVADAWDAHRMQSLPIAAPLALDTSRRMVYRLAGEPHHLARVVKAAEWRRIGAGLVAARPGERLGRYRFWTAGREDWAAAWFSKLEAPSNEA